MSDYRTEEDRRLDPFLYEGICFHKPVSVNAAYYKNKGKTVAYKMYEKAWWKMLDGDQFDSEHCEDIKKIYLRLDMVMGFSNNAADLDNSLKTTIDILQFHFGFDDKQVRLIKAKKVLRAKGHEFAHVRISEIFIDQLDKEVEL